MAQFLSVFRCFWRFFACDLEIPESGERSLFVHVFLGHFSTVFHFFAVFLFSFAVFAFFLLHVPLSAYH